MRILTLVAASVAILVMLGVGTAVLLFVRGESRLSDCAKHYSPGLINDEDDCRGYAIRGDGQLKETKLHCRVLGRDAREQDPRCLKTSSSKSTSLPAHLATPWMANPYERNLADLNGDGRSDIVAAVSAVHHQYARGKNLPPAGTPVVAIQGEDRSFHDQPFLLSWRPASGFDAVPVFVDVTQDGRDDLVQIAPPARSSGGCGGSPASLTSNLCGSDYGRGPQWITARVAKRDGTLGPDKRVRLLDERGRNLRALPWKSTLAWDQSGAKDTVWVFAGDDTTDGGRDGPPGTDGGITVAMEIIAPMTLRVRGTYEGWWGPRGDINGDGHVELLIQQGAGSDEFVVHDTSSGETTTLKDYPTGILRDVTGDGRADVAGVRKKSGNVIIYKGTPQKTFSNGRVVSGVNFKNRTDYKLADVNNDGNVDLLVGTAGSGNRPAEWHILLGDRHEGFLPPRTSLLVQGDLVLSNPEDVDGDGNVDLMLVGDARPMKEIEKGGYMDATYVAWGKGDGTFE